MAGPTRVQETHLQDERWELLEHIHDLIDKPLVALSFVWLLLLVLDLTVGLGPLLQALVYVIWGVFVVDFVVEIAVAPRRLDFLRRHWLTAVSLFLPALGILRILRVIRLLRAARAVRSLSLLRLVTSLNRGMRAVRSTVGANTVSYVVALTVIVSFAGAAGMYYFENPGALRQAGQPGTGLASFGDAVWWTAMVMTTLGSDYFPKTAEGRILGWLLALYAFAVFGLITGTIASWLIGRRQASVESEASALAREVAELRSQVAALAERLDGADEREPAKRDQ